METAWFRTLFNRGRHSTLDAAVAAIPRPIVFVLNFRVAMSLAMAVTLTMTGAVAVVTVTMFSHVESCEVGNMKVNGRPVKW